MMDESSGKVLADIEEIKILVAILEIFHLLPSTATCFLEELIHEVIMLDIKIKRYESSPFKAPLIKYLNKYPVESIDYFLRNIEIMQKRRLFLVIITASGAESLRNELSSRIDIFESLFFVERDTFELQYAGIYLCNCLIRHNEIWVKSHEHLFGKILNTMQPIGEHFTLYPERINIIHTLLGLTKHFDHNGLINKINEPLLDTAINPGAASGYDIQKFLYENLICHCDGNGLKFILSNITKFLFDTSIATNIKVYGLRKLIIPSLIHNKHMLSSEIVEDSVINFLDVNVWTNFADEKKPLAIDLSLAIELIQLTVILIQSIPERIMPYRKTLFKGCNNLMKNGDIILKYSAHVLLSTCLKEFECFDQLVLNYLTSLLRSHQPEARMLVKQALDILFKSSKIKAVDSKVPFWIESIKKVDQLLK